MDLVLQAQTSRDETEQSEIASSSSDCPPPAKRAPMAELFGDIFPIEQALSSSSKSLSEVVDEEVQHYRAVQSLSVDSNPLVWRKDNQNQFPHLASWLKVTLESQPHLSPVRECFLLQVTLSQHREQASHQTMLTWWCFWRRIFNSLKSTPQRVWFS